MSRLYHTRSRKAKYLVGSNQFKKVSKTTIHFSEVIFYFFCVVSIFGFIVFVTNIVAEWDHNRKLVSPLADPVYAWTEPTPLPTQTPTPTPSPVVNTTYIAKKIYEKWERNGSQEQFTALHVGKTESGLRPNAVNYNCRYGEISTSCKPEDYGNAWSVDCGIFQINVMGQSCPVELFNVETNISRAYELYQRRGWQPWVAARNLGYTK